MTLKAQIFGNCGVKEAQYKNSKCNDMLYSLK